MFPWKIKVKQGDNVYEYVRIVENYRKKGKTYQRVIANLGNIKGLKKDMNQVIKCLCRICQREYFNVENLKTKEAPRYADILTARHLWKELGLDKLIDSYMRDTEAEMPVELISFLMVEPID